METRLITKSVRNNLLVSPLNFEERAHKHHAAREAVSRAADVGQVLKRNNSSILGRPKS